MSSGELALALVSSSQRARTFKDAEGVDFDGDGAVAQPARTADSRSETIHLIGRVVVESRGSIVCSLRLFVVSSVPSGQPSFARCPGGSKPAGDSDAQI
jgi:hypothetical protein